MVQGRLAYIVARTPRRNGSKPGRLSTASSPSRSAAVKSGFTAMPSGVFHTSDDGSSPSSLRARSSQSERARGASSLMPKGYDQVVDSACLGEMLRARGFERLSGGGHSGSPDAPRAGVEVPVAPVRGPATGAFRSSGGPYRHPVLRPTFSGRGWGFDQTKLRAHVVSIPGGYDTYSSLVHSDHGRTVHGRTCGGT